MQCPKCGGKGRVTSTFDHGSTLLRYRRCRLCGHGWKAWEEIDPNAVKDYRARQPKAQAETDLFEEKQAS